MELLRGRTVDGPAAGDSGRLEMRRGHLRAALQLVVQGDGRMTRAEIARRSGLTSATVSSLLTELIRDGYVQDGQQAVSTGGKRATTLKLDRDRHGILVVTLRPLIVRGAILNLAGEVVSERSDRLESGATPEDVARFVEEFVGDTERNVLCVGLRVPGTTIHGRVVESVQLAWYDEPVAEVVTGAVGVPCVIINDADAEALSESISSREAAENSLFIHLGEGIGAAIIRDGEVMIGPSGRAGEIGHVRVVYEGSRNVCRCGLTGCLESTSSLTAMLGPAFRDESSFEEVHLLAEAAGAQERLADGAKALARAIRLICAAFDVGEVVLGGSAPALGARFISDVADDLEMYPAKGARLAIVRFAQSSSPFNGVAQYALSQLLGVRWSNPPAQPDGALR
ncbi:ROK family transcriptional regulator [Arthrobacter sp. 2MCAF14]|uniref:ROK family transcriptional regulator n=1 Tax=Arthrobacter sp. 2MCAF14 TaxID=3232982 RepID=UPI003F90ECF0